MATINVTCKNATSDSRLWVILDLARDPNAPPVAFQGYLDPGASTDALPLYSADGIYGKISYQRSDGAQNVTDVTDGSVVSME